MHGERQPIIHPQVTPFMRLTPRQRVEAVLFGGQPDHVPFTVYEYKLPQCAVERQLRNDGLCIMNRHYLGYSTVTPHCTTENYSYTDEKTGKGLIRTVVRTPKGDLTSLAEPADFTSWRHELMFKGPEDYEKLVCLADDSQFVPAYDGVLKAQERLGEDVFLRGGMPGYSPLQALIYTYLGVETFCVEWLERRDEVLRLYAALHERARRAYAVVADSPHRVIQYCGNVSPEIVGLERFNEYVLPHYDELAEELRKRGKLLLVHLDANCRLFADAIACSGIDIVEAFTPAPDTDLTLAEARAAWPEKILWINFPSSVHLSSDEVVYETTRDLIAQDGGSQKLLIGITEDVPEPRWQGSFQAISRAIAEHGQYVGNESSVPAEKIGTSGRSSC